MNVYQKQESEARLYNKAFLHGREFGLSDGKKIAIGQVLEIIEKAWDEADGKPDLIHEWNTLRMIHKQINALKGEQG